MKHIGVNGVEDAVNSVKQFNREIEIALDNMQKFSAGIVKQTNEEIESMKFLSDKKIAIQQNEADARIAIQENEARRKRKIENDDSEEKNKRLDMETDAELERKKKFHKALDDEIALMRALNDEKQRSSSTTPKSDAIPWVTIYDVWARNKTLFTNLTDVGFKNLRQRTGKKVVELYSTENFGPIRKRVTQEFPDGVNEYHPAFTSIILEEMKKVHMEFTNHLAAASASQ